MLELTNYNVLEKKKDEKHNWAISNQTLIIQNCIRRLEKINEKDNSILSKPCLGCEKLLTKEWFCSCAKSA